MSRETDSSSSGPQGRGGAAYPSGTPPYGPPGGDRGTGADGVPGPWRQAPEHEAEQPAAPDEPETQTTLTTRIRINIPGSRPIPPVVMRTPVAEGESTEAAGPASPLAGPGTGGTPSGAPTGGSPAGGGKAAGDSTSTGERATSDWFAPRKPAQAASGTTSGLAATTASGSTGSSGSTAAPSAPAAPSGTNGGARGDLPYFSESGDGPSSGASERGAGDGPRSRPGRFGPGANGSAAPAPPTGPTGGPATGDGPVLPAAFQKSAGSGISAGPNGPLGPGAGPGGPGAGSAGLGDDTAVLTPQSADGPPPGGHHVSGDTLTSGMPVVPSAAQSDAGFPRSGGRTPHTPPVLPDPPAPQRHTDDDGHDGYDDQDAASGTAAPKKKGRNKLVLIGVGVVGLAGVAYGAGLLMNHSDVPKGTTVLGVDIGGGTRDEAVKKLDAALQERAAKPIELSVDGKRATLKPSQAGLTVDTQETVRQAAGSDYNPVSVIGSLFGVERQVDPVMPTDEEKLRDALERIAGTSGSAAEATIKFEPGKAVPSYGKAGKQLNPEGSVTAVEAAYRTQMATGSTGGPVQLPVSAADPNVPKTEVDRMMKEFAEPAMSGLITVRTDPAHTVSFSPEKSIYKFVSVKPNEQGKLVPYYDLKVLEELYGGAFDGVQLTMANGTKKPVSPQLVAQAVSRALVGRTPAERIVQIGPEQQN